MHRIEIRVIALLIGALALSGCGGGGGGQSLPAADSVLPAEYSAAGPGTGGIGDYLTSGGSWRVNLGGKVQSTSAGNVALLSALVYDGATDKWTVNVDGVNRTYSFFATNQYDFVDPGVIGGDFTIYDMDGNPATSQYGTFARLGFEGAGAVGGVFAYVHFGVKTPLADMPATGTGVFDGNFEGKIVVAGPAFDTLSGAAQVTANFTGGTVAFVSIGSGLSNGGTATYSLTGAATITGNTYQGTMNGNYKPDGVATLLTIDPANSSLSGAFYGPGILTETAGVVQGGNTAGTQEIVGGFWTPLSTYTP